MITEDRPATPWHIWVVGVVSLLWNAGGAYDYLMTQSRNMDYLQATADRVNMPIDMMVGYYTGFPAWADATWTLGVWGAVFGSLLILLRSRYAFHAFIVSVIGIIGTTIYTLGSSVLAELTSNYAMLFSAAIAVVTVLLAIYSRRQTAAGVLR
ncbi:putative membrane protein [Aurantiacibacter atlanticus]|uniref:Putative membrane protein n=1 Tax=Aurantiacibacter atlanticus TaxID=1648404 RepID=A0A0H4VZH8_9SPHN|nr:hypothetical protein [Aurantiacibacter atlanticus]AKQ42593.1 putative membrane protein [Aurantiacibacter atlanticus]MDF1834906.1 hypothetical protein [Alteraurantiacibacter sp. bin_em_oilr2.035]